MRTATNVLFVLGLMGWLLLLVSNLASVFVGIGMFGVTNRLIDVIPRVLLLAALPVVVGGACYWIARRFGGVFGLVSSAIPLALLGFYVSAFFSHST
jgi:hypothetical protein